MNFKNKINEFFGIGKPEKVENKAWLISEEKVKFLLFMVVPVCYLLDYYVIRERMLNRDLIGPFIDSLAAFIFGYSVWFSKKPKSIHLILLVLAGLYILGVFINTAFFWPYPKHTGPSGLHGFNLAKTLPASMFSLLVSSHSHFFGEKFSDNLKTSIFRFLFFLLVWFLIFRFIHNVMQYGLIEPISH